ncbi:MAG: ATP-binding protein, partial [Planctomycetota bacterium]|nr:ATP-binding protein [Planctomycetota bacterium]
LEQVNNQLKEDIGRREEAEQALSEAHEKLERSRRMEAIGILAGGVAHDLNNILSGIASYPDLLLMDKRLSSEARESVEIIKDSGQRAAAVVADLLTVAKGVTGARIVISPNETVQQYLASPECELLRNQNPAVEIEAVLDPDLQNLKASRVHLRKALMNLVTNAAEAMESGHIQITTRNEKLNSPLKGYEEAEPGEYVVLSVSDTGPGISAEDLDRIFEPFYTQKALGRSGTGLGLTVVWNTVHDHDGYIDVQSSNSGSTFELFFPKTDAPLERETKVSFDGLSGDGESILIVDDIPAQRQIATLMLERLGYTPHAVHSGEEALSYLESHGVDLVLLDMIMEPGISGLETYSRIVETKGQQKAIIASGYSRTSDVQQAQQLGAGTFLRKPYTLANLGIAVCKELRPDTAEGEQTPQ